MALTGSTRRVDIPHEPGEWMELRRLSWRQLEEASDAATNASLERIKRLGGEVLAAIRQAADDQEADPAARYDFGAVLRAGIVHWSYEAAVTPETIDALDEETAAWAVREILALNRPRTDDEQKNGSSPSTKP